MNTKTTPKDFFLWFGAMLSLYGGVIAFLALIFDYINYTFPNPLSYSYFGSPYSGSMPYEMASLIVLAPVFLILMRVIRRNIHADASRREVWVRRWALFLTVFLAGATIVTDLIILITSFLSGQDFTISFLLKILVVLLVASAGFMHFLADLWGFWEKYPQRARAVNYGTGIVVVVAVVSGFFIVGTPQQAREMRYDEQRANDLQTIQYQITNYYQAKHTLPANLSELTDALSGSRAPVDPKTAQAYEYAVKGTLSFELCANFAQSSVASRASYPEPSLAPSGKGFDNWQHEAGHKCFQRTIDPDLYPPFTKPVNF